MKNYIKYITSLANHKTVLFLLCITCMYFLFTTENFIIPPTFKKKPAINNALLCDLVGQIIRASSRLLIKIGTLQELLVDNMTNLTEGRKKNWLVKAKMKERQEYYLHLKCLIEELNSITDTLYRHCLYDSAKNINHLK